jgi:hypothetical protein
MLLYSLPAQSLVSLFLEGIVEVLEVAFANIFDPKIINRQAKPYLLGFLSL